ncbi:MAG: hypothetical protein EBS54_10235 [Betaproteobacteria bacterium]|nr:hypothetical protein [Betaproteobacteria bacterium]
MIRATRVLPLIVLLALASGCANRSEVKQLAPAMSRPTSVPRQVEATGAIFRTDAPQRGLFDDRRARYVGDIITIVLRETVTSSKQAGTTLTGPATKVAPGSELYWLREQLCSQ